MLDERQLKAAEGLAKGMNIKDTAAYAGVSRNTIYAWKEMETFQAEVSRLKHEFLEQTQAILKSEAISAAKQIINLSKNAASEKVKLQASIDILDRNLGKATTRVELDDGRRKDVLPVDLLAGELAEFDSNEDNTDDNNEQ